MNDNEKGKFANLLTDTMAYYGKDVSPFLLAMFWEPLSWFDYAEVHTAFAKHMASTDNGQWAPKVADIMRMIEGSSQSQGLQAWSKVQRAIGSVGRNQSVAFDDPLIHVVISEMGGWYELCGVTLDDLPFRAKDFEARYRAYKSRRETPPFAPYLMGGHESQNRIGGFETKSKPVLVGDPDLARQVMDRGSQKPAIRITDARSLAEMAVKRISDEAP